MIKDFLRLGVENIRHRGIRSWLTMIGIFIGIAAVVSLVSLGQGLEASIKDQFNAIGTDILLVQPLGAGFVSSGEDNPSQITTRDEDEVRRTSGVFETTSAVFRSERIEYKDKEVSFQFITGIDIENTDKQELTKRVFGYKIAQGRDLKKGDKFKVVAGHDYTQKDVVFSKIIRPGSKVMIKDQEFEVIGTMKKIGNPTDDRQFLMEISVAEDLLGIGGEGGAEFRDFIIAQIDPTEDPNVVSDNVHRKLMNFRDLDEGEENFEVQTASELLGSFNTILAIVQAVLIGIAAISLLVGGIGITNTMYTAVLERTKEIGIMKAIGAKNSDIAIIFLTEAGLLGLVGGAVGVLLGFGISSSVTGVAAQFLPEGLLKVFFPPWLIFGGLGFSFVVGAVSGVLPAIQASRMNPVDALRYE